LAWFYCDGTRNLSARTDIRYILGSILRQLLEASEKSKGSHLKSLKQLQETANDTVDSKLANLFIDTILSTSKTFSQVYIVVDGIDECPKRTELCESILKLSGANVKVLITSRRERDIADLLHNQNQVEISKDSSSADISIHIDWMFENDKKLTAIKSDLKKQIKSELLSSSSGM
jgi:hypothetical protein